MKTFEEFMASKTQVDDVLAYITQKTDDRTIEDYGLDIMLGDRQVAGWVYDEPSGRNIVFPYAWIFLNDRDRYQYFSFENDDGYEESLIFAEAETNMYYNLVGEIAG